MPSNTYCEVRNITSSITPYVVSSLPAGVKLPFTVFTTLDPCLFEIPAGVTLSLVAHQDIETPNFSYLPVTFLFSPPPALCSSSLYIKAFYKSYLIIHLYIAQACIFLGHLSSIRFNSCQIKACSSLTVVQNRCPLIATGQSDF